MCIVGGVNGFFDGGGHYHDFLPLICKFLGEGFDDPIFSKSTTLLFIYLFIFWKKVSNICWLWFFFFKLWLKKIVLEIVFLNLENTKIKNVVYWTITMLWTKLDGREWVETNLKFEELNNFKIT